MELGLWAFLVAFVLTAVMIKLLQPFAYAINLVDKPGGRKKHDGIIPLIGGIAVFASVFLTGYIFLEQPTFVRFFMLGAGFIVFLGALDDRYDLSPRFRLVGQFLIASIFVYGLDVFIASFGDLLGIGEIKLGWFGYPISILSLVAVVNAFNMLDGIDGLIGSLALVSFTGLAYLFGAAGNANLSILCLTFVGAIASFLVFNIWGRASNTKTLSKVFMGDAGSMLVGLTLGVLLIAGSQGEARAFEPCQALWFVLFPMTDMVTLMYRRLSRGRSPFSADRTHIHHILQRAGFKNWQVLNLLMLMQLTFILMAVVVSYFEYSEAFHFALAGAFLIAYQLFLRRSWRFIRWNKRRFAL